MIENQQYRYIPTELELNGPILSFTSQPSGLSTDHAGVATYIGLATATFPTQVPANPALNSGSISYQWYEVGVGALSNGTNVTGAATTTLTLSNLVSPTDNGRQFYLSLDYEPSGDTPNANNEPLNSDTVSLEVLPYISITTQPSSVEVGTDADALFTVEASLSDTSFGELRYQWQLDQTNLSDSSTVSGSQTPNLTISRSTVGVSSIRVLIFNNFADTVTSNEVSLTAITPRRIIKLEGYGTTSTATLASTDIETEYTISASTFNFDTICLYAAEKDVEVEMDLCAGPGSNFGSFSGGEGGYSRIRFTMKKEEEYILRGIKSNTGLFLYRKGSLIAAVGQGGSAGSSGSGGKGGGVDVSGSSGSGSNAGAGGEKLSIGGLAENGRYGSASQLASSSIYPEDNKANRNNGGRTIKCSKGIYWRDQGKSPCENLGDIKFRLSDGTEVTNSGIIARGFKDGYVINRTAGGGSTSAGNGGDGASGGNGGGVGKGGGGGGSGYSDGSIEIVKTQLGGCTGNANVIIREPSLDQVTFTVSRSAGDSNTVTFTKRSGDGPGTITFGPDSATITVQMSVGAVYMRTSSTNSGPGSLNFRLSGNTLGLDDRQGAGADNDYNDLTITPNRGTFTSDSRYVL